MALSHPYTTAHDSSRYPLEGLQLTQEPWHVQRPSRCSLLVSSRSHSGVTVFFTRPPRHSSSSPRTTQHSSAMYTRGRQNSPGIANQQADNPLHINQPRPAVPLTEEIVLPPPFCLFLSPAPSPSTFKSDSNFWRSSFWRPPSALLQAETPTRRSKTKTS